MSEKFAYRLMDTYHEGWNRSMRRSAARATRMTSSPRRRGPIPREMILFGMKMREKARIYGPTVVGSGLQGPEYIEVDGGAIPEGPANIPAPQRGKGHLRDVSDQGPVPGVR